MGWDDQVMTIVRVAIAMLLGGLIGMERELADKPAGLRTHMLLAGATALLVGLGNAFILTSPAEDGLVLRSDPIRTMQAIITGISFLGAGTIIRRVQSERIEGLTTAAALLVSGGLGIACALDQYYSATGMTVLTLIVLTGFKYIERRLRRPQPSNHQPEP